MLGKGLVVIKTIPNTLPIIKMEALNKMIDKRWERIGFLSKRVNDDLNEIKKLAKKEKLNTEPITRTITQINKFRNQSENIMLSRGKGSLSTFYGRDNNERE